MHSDSRNTGPSQRPDWVQNPGREDPDGVWVRRQPAGIGALYAVDDLERPHWDTISGGVRQPTSGVFLWAYVPCDRTLDGEVAHSGRHGPCPHSIKVVVQKNDNPDLYERLAALAGPKPSFYSEADCARDVIRSAGPEGITQQDLRLHAGLDGPGAGAVLKRVGASPNVQRDHKCRPDAAGRPRLQCF